MTFRRRVLDWYARHRRDLPWRGTRDPYAILVSEVMLQQTQAARVVGSYQRFLRRFPTLRALARASLADVLRAWAGLGYNRRARNLHRIARARAGGLPPDVAGLDALPGVGAYTASAVACFAHGRRVAFADTNIRRVLGRVFLGRAATEREALLLDRLLLPDRSADRWHHALMDLGATVCRARAPRCASCPVGTMCLSRGAVGSGAPRRRPAEEYWRSARRARGRIVEALRAAPHGLSLPALRRAVGDQRVPSLVGALAAEGLLERRGARVRLPE